MCDETPRERALAEVHPDDARPLRTPATDDDLPDEWKIPVVEIPSRAWGK